MDETYLTPEQVVEIVPGVSKNLLAQMRFRGDGPPFVKVGRAVVYAKSSLHSWLADRERTRTDERVSA